MKRPGVGLSIILMDYSNKSVLLGKRKNSHGGGTWAFPGGNLEYGETFLNCAEREMKEETGLIRLRDYTIHNLFQGPFAVTEDIFGKEEKHYITLFFRACYNSHRIPLVMEPDKCEEWKWFEWDKLPKDELFLPVKNLIEQDYNPFTR